MNKPSHSRPDVADRRKIYRVLLVDSNSGNMKQLLDIFKEPAKVERASTADTALQMLGLTSFDLVVLQLNLRLYSGVDLAEEINKIKPDLPIVPYSDQVMPRDFAEITKMGYPTPPIFPTDKDELIRRCLEYQEAGMWYRTINRIRHELETAYGFSRIFSATNELHSIFKSLSRITSANVPVMVTGESGTGKELIARAIHSTGDRKHAPFIAVNCAAVPEGLLESQFFGHEAGAFTGATSTVKGKFEVAHNGTMFLDEIGEMSAILQAKLLRVLEHGEFERVGGNNTIKVDVRLITATNRNLDLMVSEGTFREDLFYRINLFPIHLPPLRQRGEDIRLLSYLFLRNASRKNGRQVHFISEEAFELIENYDWHGNIRELENAVERALLLCDGVRIEAVDFPNQLNPSPKLASLAPQLDLSGAVEAEADEAVETIQLNSEEIIPLRDVERAAIKHALNITDGNIAQAARQLGISRNTLYKKIQEFGLEG